MPCSSVTEGFFLRHTVFEPWHWGKLCGLQDTEAYIPEQGPYAGVSRLRYKILERAGEMAQ